MNRIAIAIVTCFVVVCLLSASGIAQIDGEEVTPIVAYDPETGHYLSVFVQWNATNAHILGEVLRVSDGQVLNQFIVFNLDDNYNPDLAYDSDNDVFLIVWEHNVSGDADIYGKYVRVNPDGSVSFRTGYETPDTANLTVNCETGGNQMNPAIAYDPTSTSFLVIVCSPTPKR